MSWEDCPKCGTDGEIVTDSRGLVAGRACLDCEFSWDAPRIGVDSSPSARTAKTEDEA